MIEDFTADQIDQIDNVYSMVIELVSTMTKKPVTEIDANVYGQIADVVADMLVSKGFTVHFPTIVDGAVSDYYI